MAGAAVRGSDLVDHCRLAGRVCAWVFRLWVRIDFHAVSGSVFATPLVRYDLVAMDIFGPVPNLPRAYRDGRPMMILWMILGMGLALPLGLLVLGQMDTLLFRYLVSGIALSAPLALIAGFRIRAAFLTPKVLFGVGVCGGFLGGISGMPGPPVIILHMASRLAPAIIRANTMIYLFLFDLSLLLSMTLSGDLVALPVVIGLVLLVPSMLGNIAGGYIFNPEKETFYRWVAYIVTLAAAVGSLPLWD